MISVTEIVTGIFKPMTDLIDDIHTSKGEELELKIKMLQAQTDAFVQAQKYDSELLEAQKSIIVAEAKGGSWLQQSWRPITMLTFLGLVVLNSLGWLAIPLAPEAWNLLQIGLGGYVIGRSAEKVMKRD